MAAGTDGAFWPWDTRLRWGRRRGAALGPQALPEWHGLLGLEAPTWAAAPSLVFY